MKRWWILKDRLRHGPYTEPELLEHVTALRFAPTDFVVSEDSQGVTQLSHHTIREVLGNLPLAETRVELEARPSGMVSVDEAASSTKDSASDPIPKIRELLSKIEAVELIDSAERAGDTNIHYQSVEHSNGKAFTQSLFERFRSLKPAFAMFAIFGVGFWLYKQNITGRGSVTAPIAAVDQTVKAGVARAPAAFVPKTTGREPVAAPKVKVPAMSQRSSDGFERSPATRSSESQDDEILGSDQESPSRGLASRRERLRKLRNAMVPPPNSPEAESEALPGVAAENNDEQSQYDDERYLASDPSDNEDAPYIEDQEVEHGADDSQDNGGDVGYQE